MVGHRKNVAALGSMKVVGVKEVRLAFADDIVIFRMMGQRDVVPPHVRDLHGLVTRLDQPHFTLDPAKTGCLTVFQAPRGKQLHPDANAQEWRAADEHTLVHRLDHASFRAKASGTCAEAAHTGQDYAISCTQHIGIGSNRDLRANLA